MKTIVMRSLIISLVVAIAITLVSSILMATYHQSSEALGVNQVLTGTDAIAAMIKAFGIVGYLRGLVGGFVLFFVSIFLGAVWQGVWTLKKGG